MVSGRSVEIDPLAHDLPPGDDWDKSTMGLYSIDSASVQSTPGVRANSSGNVTRLATRGGVWRIDTKKGTVSFAADADFVGRDRVGFSVTTKLGVEYRTVLSVKVKAAPSQLPVSGANPSIAWALWSLFAGALLLVLVRARIRRI